MSEYIFDVPDSNQPIAGDIALYYPDERDEPMMVREEIVRCRDCRCYEQTIYGPTCHHFSMSSGAGWPVEPDGFCAWACRK